MKSSNEFKVRKWWENGENYTWTLIKMINKKKIKLEGEKKTIRANSHRAFNITDLGARW